MKENEYMCAVCGEVFEKGLTDEGAVQQLKEEFGGGWTPDDCELVCDGCYRKMFGEDKE